MLVILFLLWEVVPMLISYFQKNVLSRCHNLPQCCQRVQHLGGQVNYNLRDSDWWKGVSQCLPRRESCWQCLFLRRGGDGLPAPGDNLPFAINNRFIPKLYIFACSLFINQTGTSWLPTSSYSLALDWPSPSLPWDTSCWRSRSLRGGFTQCIASSPLRCQSLFVRSSEKIYLEILMLLETWPCLDNWLDLLTWICGQQILRQGFLFFVCGKDYE